MGKIVEGSVTESAIVSDSVTATVERAREALKNCEDLPDQIVDSLGEKPDSFFEFLIDRIPQGLDAVKDFLGPEYAEWAQIIFELISSL